MLKKTVTVLTFLLLIIGLIAFPTFSASIAKGQEELKIKDTLYQYFDSKYKALGSLTEVSYKYYYDSSNEDMDLNQESVNADIGFRKKLPDDYGFKKYKFYLNYNSVKISGNSAMVELTEAHDIWFNCIPDEQPSQMANCKHIIKLVKKGEQWKIKKDDYFDWTKNSLSEYMKQGKTAKEAKDLVIKNCSVDYKKNVYPVDEEAIDSNLVTTAATLKTYYRSNAVSYADTWALSRNPAWGDYSNLGGDCTNFTSQCLKAGYIPFDTTGSSSNLKWYWYSDSNRVPPWTGAKEFNYYAKNNNTGTTSNSGLYAYTTSWSNLAPGDICQLLWSDGTAKHSMIIVARVTDPILGTLKDYLIDCHSTDQKRYPLSLYTDPKVYFKIAGYY